MTTPPRRPRKRVLMTAGLTASASVMALQISLAQAERAGGNAVQREDVASVAANAEDGADTPEAGGDAARA